MKGSTNDLGLDTSPRLEPNAGLIFSKQAPLEPPFKFRKPTLPTPYSLLKEACDPDYPRVFHIFWAGPFTDKPYIAILSFLFTQNVDLHRPPGTPPAPGVCRPQLWLWINPGPAASIPNPHAQRDMYDSLASNPWSAPFLHPRFEHVVKFKLWNTTEQLDGIPEIKDEWRTFDGSLFNSGGYVYNVPSDDEEEKPDVSANSTFSGNDTALQTKASKKKKGGMYDRMGSPSSQDYDRMSVILSDMARFLLCHRFGGTYLDADTIFLRDWEELWVGEV